MCNKETYREDHLVGSKHKVGFTWQRVQAIQNDVKPIFDVKEPTPLPPCVHISGYPSV